MAIRILKTSSLLSATATKTERVEASNLVIPSVWAVTGQWMSTNTTRTINVVFANAGNQMGLTLFVRGCHTGTLTITLREGTTVRTTNTFNFTTTPLTPTAGGAGTAGWHYFPLTSYAVTTAAATWNYQLSCTSSTPMVGVTTASGTDALYAASLDADSGAITNSDTTILSDGVILDIDGSVTHAATGLRSVIQCYNSVYRVLPANLSAPITITFNGDLFPSYSSKFYVGSDGTTTYPIPLAKKVTIDITPNPSVWLVMGSQSSTYVGIGNTNGYELYGEEDNYIATRVASTAAAGQAHIITTQDMSGQWQIGDALCLIGKARPGVIDSTNYTIAGISGTDITLNTNLDYQVLQGAGIVNGNRRDKCGIKIMGLNTQSFMISSSQTIDYCHLVGVNLLRVAFIGGTTRRTTKNNLIRNVLFEDDNLSPVSGIIYMPSTCSNSVISGLYHFSTRSTYMAVIFCGMGGNNNTVSNVFTKHTYYTGAAAGAIYMLGNGNTYSGLVHAGGRYAAGGYNLYFSGASNNYTDVFSYGLSEIGFTSLLINSLIDGITINGNFSYSGNFSNTIGLSIKNGKFGNITAAGTSEFTTVADTINQVVITSPIFGTPVAMVKGLDVSLKGSYVRIADYNGTTNDNRGYEVYGNYISTGTGLTDTTTHNSSGFALRRQSVSSTNRDTWSFKIPSGNIQNKTATFIIWCKINSAVYYGGTTFEPPRIDINYDNGTHRYAWASTTGTDWQRLTISFTPTTTYGEVEITMSTMTDATGSDAYVYWSEYDFQLPSGVQVNPGVMTYWSNGLPITGLSTNITEKGVSDAVWDDLIADHAVANSFATKLKSLKNASLLIDNEIII